MATGGTDFGERTNDRLPFDSLVLAGLALAVIVAIPLTVLAWSAWTGAARTDDVALIAGLLIIAWIVVQVVVLRAFSLFQPAYLGIGAYFVAASHRVRLGPRRRGILLVAVGTILVAVGVGLVPHLLKNGVTVMSAVSVVVLVIGIAVVVIGARLRAAEPTSSWPAGRRRRDRDRGRCRCVGHCAGCRRDQRPDHPRGIDAGGGRAGL